MTGFHIIDINTEECIHEETGFDAEYTQDMYDAVREWWDESDDGTLDAEDLLVKLFVGYNPSDLNGEEEELRLDELL
jgi:hypothetical protein